MASDERKAADSKIMAENLHKSLGAEEQGAETEGFQCHRCKQVIFSSKPCRLLLLTILNRENVVTLKCKPGAPMNR